LTVHGIEVSAAHMAKSDQYLLDAGSVELSERGRSDSAFEAGYFALLAVLTSAERESFEHPSADVVQLACKRMGLDAAAAMRFASTRYSPEGAPVVEVLAWAEDVRLAVRDSKREFKAL
jgi:hypothetical protein